MEKDIKNKIKYLINKKKTAEDICERLGLTMQELKDAVDEIKNDGGRYDMEDDNPVRIKGPESSLVELPASDSDSICILSDMHLGSIYDRPDILREIYDECERRGITSILCAGDVTDGYYPLRKRYCDAQKVQGPDKTLDYVLNTLPFKDGITMYSVSGNHDDTLVSKGESILNRIAYFRKDFVNLGTGVSELTFDDERIKLMHGYSSQITMDGRLKGFYEEIPDWKKPSLLISGHIHQSGYKEIGKTKILQCASLMDSPPHVKRKFNDEEKSCFFVHFIKNESGVVIDTEIEQVFFKTTSEWKRVR